MHLGRQGPSSLRPITVLLALNVAIPIIAILLYCTSSSPQRPRYYQYYGYQRYERRAEWILAITACALAALTNFLLLADLLEWDYVRKLVPRFERVITFMGSEVWHAVLALALGVVGVVAIVRLNAQGVEVVVIVLTFIAA